MHDQLLFIIMCQNEIKTKRKWHIDSCFLATVCVFSQSAKFSPCDPPARLQRVFILQSRDGRRHSPSRADCYHFTIAERIVPLFGYWVAGPLVVAILNPALSDQYQASLYCVCMTSGGFRGCQSPQLRTSVRPLRPLN